MNISVLIRRALRTIDSCANNYRYYPGVCGVSFGQKYKEKKKVSGSQAVQFFVTNKKAKEELRKKLPKFVYERYLNGKLNRNSKIDTDVIELKNMAVCCEAGNKLELVGGNGTTTMLFRNKITETTQTLMLTCSHVVGDLTTSPATEEGIVGGTANCFYFAKVLGNTTITNRSLDFDLALCEVDQSQTDPSFRELNVAGEIQALDSFEDTESISIGNDYSCVFPNSGEDTITIESLPTSFRDIKIAGENVVSIGNLYACRGAAVSGDSGGIIYSGSKAVGILVAKADDDWVFIHSLEQATNALANELNMPFQIFS